MVELLDMTMSQKTNIESQHPAIKDALDSIEASSRDAGMYLRILLEEMAPYANDSRYQEQPELVGLCFGPEGLNDDINEIIHHLTHDIPPLVRSECLMSLLVATEDSPVYSYYIEQICDYFDVKLQKTESNKGENVIRFYAPNLHFDRKEEENFFRACGLEAMTDEGRGSHVKWINPQSGVFMGLSTDSKRVWLKNSIKNLLDRNLAIERIQAACDALKIDFKILSR